MCKYAYGATLIILHAVVPKICRSHHPTKLTTTIAIWKQFDEKFPNPEKKKF